MVGGLNEVFIYSVMGASLYRFTYKQELASDLFATSL